MGSTHVELVESAQHLLFGGYSDVEQSATHSDNCARAKWRFHKKLEEEDIPRPLFAALERYEAVKNNGSMRFNLRQEAKPLALRAIFLHALRQKIMDDQYMALEKIAICFASSQSLSRL